MRRIAIPEFVATALIACALMPQGAAGQQYPTRPIRWIVPVPPGATTDILSRIIAAKMSEAWGQQVIVDNRSGGAFVVGTRSWRRRARRPHRRHSAFPARREPVRDEEPALRLVKDFQPVTQVVFVPGVMVANASLPASNLKQVIALARAKPGQLPLRLARRHDLGAPVDGAAERHGRHQDHARPLQGRGAGDRRSAGRADPVRDPGPPTVMAHLKAGRLKAIATTAAKRSPGLPDTPTFAESGLPGYDTYEWLRDLRAGEDPAARAPEAQRRDQPHHQSAGREGTHAYARHDPNGGTPEEFAAFLDAERKKWGPVAQKVGLTPN